MPHLQPRRLTQPSGQIPMPWPFAHEQIEDAPGSRRHCGDRSARPPQRGRTAAAPPPRRRAGRSGLLGRRHGRRGGPPPCRPGPFVGRGSEEVAGRRPRPLPRQQSTRRPSVDWCGHRAGRRPAKRPACPAGPAHLHVQAGAGARVGFPRGGPVRCIRRPQFRNPSAACEGPKSCGCYCGSSPTESGITSTRTLRCRGAAFTRRPHPSRTAPPPLPSRPVPTLSLPALPFRRR